MYHPAIDGAIYFGEDQAVYGPIDHQRIISRLNSGLGWLYYQQKAIRYEPLPETMLDPGEASPVPDLLLYDNETEQIPVIIEVCHSQGLKKDLQKIINLIDGDLYGILEGFVYNYKTHQWFRYRKGDGGLPAESSFSDVLQLDLASFLIP